MTKLSMGERRLNSVKELVEHIDRNYKEHASIVRSDSDSLDEKENSMLFIMDYNKLVHELYKACKEYAQRTGTEFTLEEY